MNTTVKFYLNEEGGILQLYHQWIEEKEGAEALERFNQGREGRNGP